MSKSQVPNPKRCEIRSFEVIYDNIKNDISQEKLVKKLCKLKHGVYKAFTVIHTEEGKSHIHIGVILRDKPRDLYYKDLKNYFTIENYIPCQVGSLKSKSKDFKKKLQTYLDYALDQSQHEGQIIGTPYFYKFTPIAGKQSQSPTQQINSLILNGLTIDELDSLIINPDKEEKLRALALANYDKYEKMILRLENIHDKIEKKRIYKEKSSCYLPQQKVMTELLDNQNDRHIVSIIQPNPDGKGGKSYFCKVEDMREDTCFLTNGKTKDLAYMWNPKKHTRIVFNIPKGKMHTLNTEAIEALKDGAIFSPKYESYSKVAQFCPKIIICGNEFLNPSVWTEDRLQQYTMNKEHSIIKTDNECVDLFP